MDGTIIAFDMVSNSVTALFVNSLALLCVEFVLLGTIFLRNQHAIGH